MLYSKFVNNGRCIIFIIVCFIVTGIFYYYYSLPNKISNFSELIELDTFSQLTIGKKEGKICKLELSRTVNFMTGESFNNHILKSHPNLPRILLNTRYLPSTVPNIQSIRWTGINWQESEKGAAKFLLYSAHIDESHFVKDTNVSFIYILGLYDGPVKPSKYFCQLFFNGSFQAVAFPVASYDLIDWQGFSSRRLLPYLLTCIINPQLDLAADSIPSAVSLVRQPCDVPTNVLEITGINAEDNARSSDDNQNSISVGVCGPALYFYNTDTSHKLIEWIELLYMVGISKLILYKASVHKNMEKVLDYYERKNMIEIISFHYPPPYVDEPALRRLWTETKRQEMFALENIYFTDCMLRFKHQYDYLAHFDPDEIPVLKKHKTFEELMEYLKEKYSGKVLPAFFLLKWRIFYPDFEPGKSVQNISEEFYMLRHNRRTDELINPIDDNGKSIFDTKQVRAVNSHKPMLYAYGVDHGKPVVVDPAVAYTAHFRYQKCNEKCHFKKIIEEKFFEENSEELIKRVNSVVREIQFD